MYNKKLIEKVNSLEFDNSVTQIANDLKYSKGTVSSYLNGKIKASKNFIEEFANFYRIEKEELIDEKPLPVPLDSEIVKSKSGDQSKKHSGMLVPFYDIDFSAGADIATVDNVQVTPDYYMDVPEFSGCTAFRAYSDSMERLIKSGSILFGTKVEEWLLHLEYGQIYGIICRDGRRYLKYIRKNQENPKELFLLKSENESYDDFDIPKNAIRSVWLIHGWLNKRT
ncbi:LexA family transcriptional regulator [Flavobacterium sp. 102]|uniref:LexA family transcriptional regulator n=1 Tax=Flavobacterium sp. 102 TaxID=2135623 RepID=UPI000EB5CB2D|nr:LexA family transcriptional regulator [Flavobacterium sp. 102]RKS00465.1 phage repressor protein C with HTH and peptisase S24 domain [Flavobacterium sp. 102]